MKIMIVTTPLRPVPTAFAPMGSLSIINYLRKNGVDGIEFYNIDSLRPSYEDAIAHITAAAPDILGISAVVSTAYAYTKRLSLDVKKALPDTLVVVGGNLCASAEVLLRRTGVDLCAIGEGEKILLNVVRRAETTRRPADFADIPGLALLDGEGTLINTGYEAPLANQEIYDVDWRDLEAASDIGHFIFDPFEADEALSWLVHDPRAHEPHRQGKKVVEVYASKGCVARCTFCHRFEKGIRYIPIEVLEARYRHLIERYDVGFFVIADENFGTDRRWLASFCEMMKRFDVLWRVAGMRVNCIAPEFVQMMKDAGCVSIIYGMETGSPRMLEIMEKKTKVEQNLQAMEWTIGAGLYSIIQLVVGMPGETPETVRESIEFCKRGLTLSSSQNPNNLSINYAQALPGTPLYEFARAKGVIGADLDSEEAYLLRISDRNAHDEFSTLNFTDFASLECQTWRPRITIETNYAYVRRFGMDHYRRVLLNDAGYFKQVRPTGGRFANPQRLIDTSIASQSVHGFKRAYRLQGETPRLPGLIELLRAANFGLAIICYPVLFYRLRMFLPLLVILKNLARFPLGYNVTLVMDYVHGKVSKGWRKGMLREYRSLRKIVDNDFESLPGDNPAMAALRRGR